MGVAFAIIIYELFHVSLHRLPGSFMRGIYLCLPSVQC